MSTDIKAGKSSQYLYGVVKEFLRNRPTLDQATISRETGVSKHALSRFLLAKGEKEIDFQSALSLLKFFDSNSFADVMDEYCHMLHKPVGIMNSLEFASNYKRHDLTDNLLATHADKKGEMKEWLKVYSLNKRKAELSYEQITEMCKDLYGKVSSTEVKIKLDLIEASCMTNVDYQSVMRLTERLEGKVEALRDGFIKESFKMRLYGYYANSTLYFNADTEKALDYAYQVIQSKVVPMFWLASSHLTIGHAKMYDDKIGAINEIELSSKYFRLAGNEPLSKQLINNDVMFVRNYYKDRINTDLLSGEELAHQYIVREENEKAIKVIEELEESSPFALIYKGMAKKNLTDMLDGYGQLVKTGRLFYLPFVKREINNLINTMKGGEHI
ncbi:AimR family lysis-lysogeny pheromone receptor [Bacillus sp. JCM 19041]|uniref:AimR family lysis-lysogeny pheromone receptor n=1 Tax=Bacillus sp. JCM 19041 TaxID=1460637 RepID=UPI0006D1F2FB